jgi:ATP-dependent Clp protease adaptor protein ClpS
MYSEFETELEEVLEQEVAETTDQDDYRDLVVFNDDFNTFEHVIDTLIKVCRHNPQQAEQCTYIIHYKGKCTVKKGAYNELKPMKEGITDRGIKAAIV